jgi:HlyD family secretion protein
MKRKAAIPIVLVLLILIAIVWYWRSRDGGNGDAPSASGTVEATEARLGFQFAGRIAEILVREGQAVRADAVLARLDDAELEARRRQATARVAAAEALLVELQRGSREEEIAQAAAAVEAARQRYADAQRDRERNRRLYEGGAISLELYQKSATQAEVQEAQLKQAAQQLQLVREGPRQERIEAQRAQVAEARAALSAAEAALANTTIVAPNSGVVTVRHHEPNEIVAPGQPVLTLMDPSDRWVRIYVPEHRIGAIRLGSPAVIRSDTYPDKRYSGRVIYISPVAEFTPKAVQTTEERVRLVYAVKVRIEDEPELELKPGMPADVTLQMAPAADIRG